MHCTIYAELMPKTQRRKMLTQRRSRQAISPRPPRKRRSRTQQPPTSLPSLRDIAIYTWPYLSILSVALLYVANQTQKGREIAGVVLMFGLVLLAILV